MSLPEAERFSRLRLARTDRIGPVAFSQLLGRYGSAVRALDALPDLVRKSGAASIPRRPKPLRASWPLGIASAPGFWCWAMPTIRRCLPLSIRPRPFYGPEAERSF